MKGKHKAALAVAALAVAGGLAYAYGSDEEDEGEDEHTDTEAAGMLLGDDCSSITVVDPAHFVEDFTAWAVENDVANVLELTEPQDVEEMLVMFLEEMFPGCEWPPEGGAFTWDAPLPPMPGAQNAQQYATRSWEQLINSVTVLNAGLASAVNPIAATAEVLASSRALGPVPTPTPDEGEPDDDRPLPPIPPIPPDGLGSGGGDGEIIPENLLQAVDAHHMIDAGVERAMEPQGSLSPLPSSIVVVFDPEYPDAGDLEEILLTLADEHPELVVVVASVYDTQAAFGLPEEIGTVGFAINAANRVSKYWKPDEARAFGMEDRLPKQKFWRDLLRWALGPDDSTQPQRFGFSSGGQASQPGG